MLPWILFGYTVGSVPFAYLLARRAGVDVRVAGSGNVGAANVLRTSGTPLGLTVMILEDPTLPIVSTQVLYKVGGRTECSGATGLAHFVDRADARMRQGRNGAGLLLEAAQVSLILSELRGQKLDRHLATQLNIFGQVDFSHPACPDQ